MDRTARVAALIASGKYKEEDRVWLNNVPETALSVLESHPGSPSNPLPPGGQQPIPSGPVTTPGQPASTPTAPATPAPVQPPPVAPVTPTTAATKPVNADEFIGQCSDPVLRESLRAGMRMANERRASLISGIKACSRNKFTDEQLSAKSTDELETLAELAQVPVPEVSFDGRGGPRVPTVAAGRISPPPSFVAELSKKSA